MIGRGSWPSTRGRAGAAGAALLLAVGLTLAPPSIAPAAAATGRLLVSSAATYAVDPAAAVVHVSDVVTFRNDKPSDSSFFYYWRDLSWNVHPEATAIAVRDSSGGLRVTPQARDGYVEATFRLRRNLLYGQSVTLTISWDLPGGAPRSESSIRVGEAFATFDLWAWGDNGESSVTVTLPPGFEATTYGADLEQATTAEGLALTASPIATPYDFWAAVVAVRSGSMASDELVLPAGITVLVRGWPEDTIWRTTVLNTLRPGLPALQELIGLPWPVDHELEVAEVYTPLLEGYAGIYYIDEERIEISEDLDPLTIVHEASHAWFNDELFDDRWIGEGLADTYATAVLEALGEETVAPERPLAGDPGSFDLVTWLFPGRIDDDTVARETYGYNASWFVVDEVYEEIGPEAMRAVLAAADADEIAYHGVGEPERIRSTNNWRRFLDLLEEVGGSERAEPLIRRYVATNALDRDLDERVISRNAYEQLVDAGDGWLPPLYIRSLMGTWAFAKVGGRIDEAHDILDLRDDVVAASQDLDVKPDDALRSAYESADTGFQEATEIGGNQLDALATLEGANEAVEAESDIVATVGLLGEDPDAAYAAASDAFERGELDEARDLAVEAVALVEAAPGIGRERLAIAAGIAAAGLLVVLMAILLVRRRRRLRPMAAGTTAIIAISTPLDAPGRVTASPTEPAAAAEDEASAIGPYGTLAAGSPAPPPDADRQGGPDGGTADGEGSSAAP